MGSEQQASGLSAGNAPASWRPVPRRVVATWPIGTFVENMAVRADGVFVLSLHSRRLLVTVTRDGVVAPWASLPTSPAGLVATREAVFAVAGEPGQGPHRVFRIGQDDGVSEHMTVPETLFLNGFTPAGAGRAYAVDSILGAVIEIDLRERVSRLVVRHALLAKTTQDPMLPGANGIKVGPGALFITNTDRRALLRAPLDQGGPTGEVEIVTEDLRGDDLALDANGSLYVTNHVLNTLTRLDPRLGQPGGARVVIAGPEQGMAGCTSCQFHPADPGGLYVTTTGGVIMPLDGVPQEAKFVRLETGAPGLPVPLAD